MVFHVFHIIFTKLPKTSASGLKTKECDNNLTIPQSPPPYPFQPEKKQKSNMSLQTKKITNSVYIHWQSWHMKQQGL